MAAAYGDSIVVTISL